MLISFAVLLEVIALIASISFFRISFTFSAVQSKATPLILSSTFSEVLALAQGNTFASFLYFWIIAINPFADWYLSLISLKDNSK